MALIVGVAYVFATPPTYVPDEVAHFWRAASLAHGSLRPPVENGVARAPLPEGYQVFVFCVYRNLAAGERIDPHQLELAWSIDHRADRPVRLPIVGTYSPVAYVPQIFAALLGRIFDWRPMIVFYLGRIFALIAFVALARYAIVTTPFLKIGFMAAALLPMTLFMAASWSADALTIGLTFAATAVALRLSRNVVLPFLLGMCKPGYFLVALLAKRWTPLLAGVAGFVLMALLAVSPPRPKQDCLPTTVIARDFLARGVEYAEQMAGRLGLLDVFLPKWAIGLEWLLLVAILLTAGEAIPRAQRLTAIAVALALMIAISATLYLTWTPNCAETVEGIQGRYFLPILPLLLLGLSNPRWRWWRPGAFTTSVIALVVNAVALHALVERYY